MRLLHVQNGTLSLVERTGNAIPPYAILSHTWARDEDEVTYQEILTGERCDKYGWHKIDFCGKQAAEDGLEYFWIDTCCVDKSSSNELGEAINSMFRWYRDSAICYVYLRDVSSTHSAEGNRSTWMDQFRKSRWFTRGWTLQELIAPKNLIFYSVEGDRLGTKHDLAYMLEDITAIDNEALRGVPLSRFSIVARLSWADGRETKREEDWAYSLFGIFDINMPLIYGEGREKAKRRLEKEIEDTYSVLLPVAEGASFDSHVQEHNATCIPDTRVSLLALINQWTGDTTGKPIFWLNGMAGTGKSTVARTIARSFAERKQLGASFFFRKGDGDLGNAKRFFTTIAMDLMANLPEMRPGIKKAITLDQQIPTRTLGTQFEKLIRGPLVHMKQARRPRPKRIVVIDALDECEQDEDIREILRLLSRINELDGAFIRVFVTSNPELYIRLGFDQMSKDEYDNIVLHEIPDNIVKHDIRVFLQSEFDKMRKHRSLPHDWPSRSQLQALVDLATPLFVFAATACRYIADLKHNPQRRLELLLKARPSGYSRLDSSYLPILHLLFEEEDEEDKERWSTEFQTIVGSIVMLRDSLSKVALAHLLNVSKFDIGCRLDSLHSVLSVPDDENLSIRTLHLSFRDCLVDPQKRGKTPWWIDERKTHETLAWRCIELMSSTNGLRRNICDLISPRASKRTVGPRAINRAIPPELAYACRFWVDHLLAALVKVQDSERVYKFLVKHFLHWLEAMRLLGHAEQSLVMLDVLLSLSEKTTDPKSYDFISDGKQFALSSDEIVKDTVLQLYSSAIVFTPTTSEIRKKFGHLIAADFETSFTIDNETSLYNQGCYVNLLSIHLIVGSHNGMTVVTAGVDMKLALWETRTGRCINAFFAHTDCISAVAYSPSDRLVASASHDTTVRLLDATIGSPIHVFQGHSKAINAIAFSGDGQTLASASDDLTIRLWDTRTGACHRVLRDHVSAVNDVAFAHDHQMLASASDDSTVRTCKTESADDCVLLVGHLGRVMNVSFSNDDRLLASTSPNKEMRIWSVESGQCKHVFRGHTCWVDRPIFSPDDRTIASGFGDGSITSWSLSEGDDSGLEEVLRQPPGWWLNVTGTESNIRFPPLNMHLKPSNTQLLDGWLFQNNMRLIRVPSTYNGYATAVRGGWICIGTKERMAVLHFGPGFSFGHSLNIDTSS